jgi:hypothetical protein
MMEKKKKKKKENEKTEKNWTDREILHLIMRKNAT